MAGMGLAHRRCPVGVTVAAITGEFKMAGLLEEASWKGGHFKWDWTNRFLIDKRKINIIRIQAIFSSSLIC